MPVRSNGYFNNPQFAQAAANLGALFAPPSGADAAGWAAANAKKEEAARLAQLFTAGATPSEQAALTGIQNYGATPQGFTYQVDQNNSTQRYGIDTQAGTSRANNTADNIRALQERQLQEKAAMERLGVTDATARYGIDTQAGTSLTNNAADNAAAMQRLGVTVATARYGIDTVAGTSRANNTQDNNARVLGSIYQPLKQGEIAPAIDPTVAAAFGYNMPTVPQREGLAPFQSEAEVKGAILRGLPEADQRNVAMSSVGVENVVTPEGPRTVFRPDAVGQEPLINKGAEAKPVNYQTPDGTRGTATVGPTGRLVDTQTQQAIPTGSVTFGTNVQGSEADTGMTTKTNMTAATALEASLDAAEFQTNKMLQILDKNPNVAGIPGRVKGIAQSLVSSASQVANAYAQEAPEAVASLEELKGELERTLGAGYDPNIVRVASGVYDLAYARAQINNPSGEVSRQAFDRSLQSFGQSFLSSQEDMSTALRAFAADTVEMGRVKVNSLRGQRSMNSMDGRKVLSATDGAPAPAPGAAPVAGAVRKYNPATGKIE